MRILKVLCLVVIGLVLSALPLLGAIYRSNSIGQLLELLTNHDDVKNYSYVIEVTQTSDRVEEQVLYESGREVKRTFITEDLYNTGLKHITEISYNQNGDIEKEIDTVYENGLPQRILTKKSGEDTQFLTHHTYSDGQLRETKELRGGELQRLISYYRGIDGVLAGLRIVDLDESEFTSYVSKSAQNTMYGESTENTFSKISLFPNNLVVRDYWVEGQARIETDVRYDEVGRLVVTEKNSEGEEKKIYAPDGLLVRSESQTLDGNTRTVEYLYDALGALDQTIETIVGEQTKKIETWFIEGRVQTMTEWLDGLPIKASRFVDDGTSVVTIFEEGRPYADITYAPDGKRVLSLEYRKER